MNNISDSILNGISRIKDSGFYKKYNKINGIFSNPVKTVIGILLIIAAVITDTVCDFSYNYNASVAIIMTIGLFSIVNAVFSAIYKIKISYFAYMFINIAGYLLYMVVLSQYEIIGTLFTVLFMVVVFAAIWIGNMCLMHGKGPAGRILGGLLVNIFTVLSAVISIAVIIILSLVFSGAGV